MTRRKENFILFPVYLKQLTITGVELSFIVEARRKDPQQHHDPNPRMRCTNGCRPKKVFDVLVAGDLVAARALEIRHQTLGINTQPIPEEQADLERITNKAVRQEYF
ncbi:hypothetical protein Bca101_014113 [Brassica carinata]